MVRKTYIASQHEFENWKGKVHSMSHFYRVVTMVYYPWDYQVFGVWPSFRSESGYNISEYGSILAIRRCGGESIPHKHNETRESIHADL
jgi:hypothetical protein